MKIRMVTAFNTRMPRAWIDYQSEILNDSTWGVGNLHKQNYTETTFQSKGGCLKQTNNKNIPVVFFNLLIPSL